ncbi:exodeoxyribonuclease VII large subunit [Parasphingopyxis marina]|uniref:Exodeoxyribonuclease 7 large subunit n=1 Tax=Parasphingopyxis marina TaxID=2761622 RepID=A0A842HUS2_9SPHN|nr:exodeoxyribonuclease VII large subunit [Parasphingopyxis marina]MBC2776131.1 exodeoxyribonuclease VII large subunit [Parasphingopyxis marina]
MQPTSSDENFSGQEQADGEAALVAETIPGDNAQPFTVSEISSALKRSVEREFGHVRIRGEISGFKRAASGHCYMGLKDEKAVIDGIVWKGQAARLAFKPEDGLEVIATGKLTTYPGRSKYQIVIDRLEVAGAGALMQLLEQRRKALAAEGLFAEERKQRLPYLPRTIGVVTSPTGAVIRDILHRLADRMPSHVILWPVIVQGEGAAEQVARAVRGFDATVEGGPIARPDLLIVARGGGSIEDLWAFNEEVVVRAVAECSIPVISAVGHETDTTLCDFAADRRAPTPTAAAEIAVPVRAELLASLGQSGLRATGAVRRLANRFAERLSSLARLLPRPESLFTPQAQRIDDLGERALRALTGRHALASGALRPFRDRFDPRLLQRNVTDAKSRLAGLARLLEQLHPERPLARGYARVMDRDGATMVSAAAAGKAEALTLKFADGTVDARVEKPGGGSYSRKTKPAAGRKQKPGQPGLFD